MSKQKIIHVSVFTTELLAHYPRLRCSLVNKFPVITSTQSPTGEIRKYRKHFREFSDTFITDVLLFNLVSRTQCAAYEGILSPT